MEENAGRKWFVNLLVLSLCANVLFASLAVFALWQGDVLRIQINDLSESNRELAQQLNLTKSQLDYYKGQAEYYSGLIASANATTGTRGHTTINIVAVRTVQKGFQVEYQGIVMAADLELKEGSGRILVDTIPRIGIDIQTSVRTGVRVAEAVTGFSLGKTDVILTVKASQDVEVVDGSSAGAAVTVSLIATIKKQNLNETVYMTGTVSSDGSIGPVGGIPEKALAAAENGSKCFLVPKGQSTVVVYVPKRTNPFPGWTVITYEKKVQSLQQYLEEHGYYVIVMEVGTIQEAYAKFAI